MIDYNRNPMDKNSFLSRVRDAAHAGRAFRVTPAEELATPLKCTRSTDGADLPARLAAEIEAVGGHVHLLDNWAQARVQLDHLLDHYRPRAALCWQHPSLEALGLAEVLTEKDVERFDYDSLYRLEPAEQRRLILSAEIGITGVTAAVAETGSLVMASSPGRERLASLAPPVHVAVLAAEQIVSDLFDLFTDDRPTLPSNWVLITGPSKTGDLELKLTTGVHGPGHWHVIIVRDSRKR